MERARTLTIDGFEISDASDCYVIAEIGHNHRVDRDTARSCSTRRRTAAPTRSSCRSATTARSTPARSSTSRTRTRTASAPPTASTARRSSSARAEYQELKAYAEEIGITFFATAFDLPSADFLAELDMPAYKIASADLIEHAAAAPRRADRQADDHLDRRRHARRRPPRATRRRRVNPQVAILQCTAGYPAAWEELDLRVIETYRELFPEAVVGLSSHDNGIAMAVAAYVLGARIVEKHFTLNRALKGTDHASRSSRRACARWCATSPRTRSALGDGDEDDVRERGRARRRRWRRSSWRHAACRPGTC